MSCSWAQAPDLSQNEDVAELYVYSLDPENPYDALSYSWSSEHGTDFDDSGRYDDQELLTDTRPDDKIVILRHKHSRRYSKRHSKCEETLAEHFSLPIGHGMDLFRCSQTDLPDIIEWLNFQQYEDCKLYQQPSFIVLEDPEVVTDDEIRRCSLAISQLLRTRTVTDLQLTLLACYIVANSYRALNACELTTAVYEAAKTRFPSDSQFMKEERGTFRQHILLKLLWTILRVRKDLKVSFCEPAMKTFLRSVSLPGVERGQGTMAQLCLSEIRRFGDTLIVQPWHGFRKWFRPCSDWPFMKYVTKYWSRHVREASMSRPDVTAQLFHQINHAVVDKSPSNTPVQLQERVIEMGHSVSRIYDLPCLTALYENMGANGDSPLLKLPTNTEFENLELILTQPLQPSRNRALIKTTTSVSQSMLTEVLPRFDMLQISGQGRHKTSEGSEGVFESVPEDLDWEHIDEYEYCHNIDQLARNSANSWSIVSQEDYNTW